MACSTFSEHWIISKNLKESNMNKVLTLIFALATCLPSFYVEERSASIITMNVSGEVIFAGVGDEDCGPWWAPKCKIE